MQLIYVAIALTVILVGLVLTISPIPFGAFLIVGGMSLLLVVSERARAFVRLERRRHPGVDRFLAKAEDEAPAIIAEPLVRTDGDAAKAEHLAHRRREAAKIRAKESKKRRKEADIGR